MTVALCPTLSLLTSDSLKATVIVIVLVLAISANGELVLPDVEEEDEVELLEPPTLPAVVPAPPPVDEPVEDEVPLDPLDVPDADAF